jgi:hypothetical protein
MLCIVNIVGLVSAGLKDGLRRGDGWPVRYSSLSWFKSSTNIVVACLYRDFSASQIVVKASFLYGLIDIMVCRC